MSVILLVRVPLLLAFAAGWAAGSYALGYLVMADRTGVALGAAFLGGVCAGAALGALTGRPWPILIGIPLAICAVTAPVYLAGIHHLESRPRLRVVVTAEGLADTSGRPLPYTMKSDGIPGRSELDVYVRSPGVVALWPVDVVEPQAGVRTATTVSVPVFAAYVLVLGVAGAFSRLAERRRFRQHMWT